MITLKDYIGKIYKDVTNAKVQSDIETLAIAQEYVQNPMLKHFAVPNIRIKDVELTIPVAIDKAERIVKHYTEKEVQEVYEQAFIKVNNQLLPNLTEDKKAYLAEIQPELSRKAQVESARTIAEINKLDTVSSEASTLAPEKDTTVKTLSTQESDTSSTYAMTINKAAHRFVDASFGFVGEFYKEERVYRDTLVKEIEINLQPRLPKIEDLPVIVETQRLKEINNPASLISIKVNITDDAMEWTTDVDENGNAIQVLDYL